MLFLEYPKCSTCQKAKKWSDEHEIKYTDRHIVEEHPTYEELKDWYQRRALPQLGKVKSGSGLKRSWECVTIFFKHRLSCNSRKNF